MFSYPATQSPAKVHPHKTAKENRKALRARLKREVPEARVLIFGPPAVRGLGNAGGFKLMVLATGDVNFDALQAQAEQDSSKEKPLSLSHLNAGEIGAEERSPSLPRELVAIAGTNRGRFWGMIYSCAFRPDGKRIAVGGNKKRVLIFDTATLREIATVGSAARPPPLAFTSKLTSTAISLLSWTTSTGSIPTAKEFACSRPWARRNGRKRCLGRALLRLWSAAASRCSSPPARGWCRAPAVNSN